MSDYNITDVELTQLEEAYVSITIWRAARLGAVVFTVAQLLFYLVSAFGLLHLILMVLGLAGLVFSAVKVWKIGNNIKKVKNQLAEKKTPGV